MQLSSVIQNVTLQNPEIHVSSEGDSTTKQQLQQPKTTEQHKLSHSCGEMGNSDPTTTTTTIQSSAIRSTSATDMCLNISQSQSESALKNKLQNLTSPVAIIVTKDLVLSPFSKLAKGMQNLGANLDVRKLSVSGGGSGGGGGGRQIDLEEIQEKWKDCKTRLIML